MKVLGIEIKKKILFLNFDLIHKANCCLRGVLQSFQAKMSTELFVLT